MVLSLLEVYTTEHKRKYVAKKMHHYFILEWIYKTDFPYYIMVFSSITTEYTQMLASQSSSFIWMCLINMSNDLKQATLLLY